MRLSLSFKKFILSSLMAGLALIGPVTAADAQEYSHGYAPLGDLRYGPDFSHFDYVNPNAPKGGQLVTDGIGSFDNFNPFIIQGLPPEGMGLHFISLMETSKDEAFSIYGQAASGVLVADDRTSVTYKIRDKAVFHDGSPITADDVVFTFDILIEKGAPQYRLILADVSKATALDDKTVRFDIANPNNLEIAATLGTISILSKADWQDHDFAKPRLDVPLGAGPYKLSKFDMGSFAEYHRVNNHWGAALPVNMGQNNFDVIRFEYYRDRNIAREALKAGKLNYFAENTAKAWATAYKGQAVTQGQLIKKEFPNGKVQPMQGFVYNLRKPIFQNPVLREALTYAFDFEWVNKTIMYDAYQRTQSFFENSYLAAKGPPSEAELALLNPLRDQLPARVFGPPWQAPQSDGSGNNRQNLRIAAKMLRADGWKMVDGRLTHEPTGQKLEFEILLRTDAIVPHVQALQRGVETLGGKMDIRIIDTAQYVQRVQGHDFDMAVLLYSQSLLPGNEQRDFWGSEAADHKGSRNYAGLKNPAIDQLVDHVISARDKDTLTTATRALDRALQWQFLAIPMFHAKIDRIAYSADLAFPAEVPLKGTSYIWWWAKTP